MQLTLINLPETSYWFTFQRADGSRFNVETTQEAYEANHQANAIPPAEPDATCVGGFAGTVLPENCYADNGEKYAVNTGGSTFTLPYSEITDGVLSDYGVNISQRWQ